MAPSPPGSSHSGSKQTEIPKKKKKSWSLEGKKKKEQQPKSRQQIKAMLLSKEKVKEEDVDAPPNSDAKDESLRIFEQQKCMPDKEEYVMKQPQIAHKRKVKKKGNRRAETVRVVRKNRSRSDSKMNSRENSREDASSAHIDTSLFKERASAQSSNANSPDNSERQREREMRRRALEFRRAQIDRSTDHSTPNESDGDSTPLPLAREPEPDIVVRRPTVVRTPVDKSASRMVMAKQEHHLKTTTPPKEPARPSQPRTVSSILGPPTSSSSLVKSPVTSKTTSETSTQLALEPEPDLDRVRRQKEAIFMKRFLTALKLLPNSAPPRPVTPVPRSDSPSDSSKVKVQR
ncbi:hypothetical protein PMAYCL1PPCAC_01739, partial [Pristionchus mayeri]